MRNTFVVFFLLLSVAACAPSRGFDRGYMRNQMTTQKTITDDEIKAVLDLKPQLPIPFKLAIYFTPQDRSNYRYGQEWTWLGEDKDKLLELGAELKQKNIVSDLFVINSSILEGSGDKAIRLAAARTGADAVLVVNGAADIDRYNNKLGYTYILLATPFFVPGTEADGLFMANAVMWDVRNQYLYLSAEAEGAAKQSAAAFFIEEGHIIKKAKSDALNSLKNEILKRLLTMGEKR